MRRDVGPGVLFFGAMHRIAALASMLAALGAAATAAAQSRPTLRAELVRCRTGDAAAIRTATFRASMPAAEGTRRMAMRFTLRQRLPGRTAFAAVRVPGWGGWERSEPLDDGFVFTRRVQRLRPGAAYRAVVVFRWYDSDGDVQRETRRLTELCAQPAR